jgi:hypothetical protein
MTKLLSTLEYLFSGFAGVVVRGRGSAGADGGVHAGGGEVV